MFLLLETTEQMLVHLVLPCQYRLSPNPSPEMSTKTTLSQRVVVSLSTRWAAVFAYTLTCSLSTQC